MAAEAKNQLDDLSPRSSVLVGVRSVLQGVVANAASRSPSASPVHGSRPSSAVTGSASGGVMAAEAKNQLDDLSPRSSVLVGVRSVLQEVVANAASRSPSASPVHGSRPSSATSLSQL